MTVRFCLRVAAVGFAVLPAASGCGVSGSATIVPPVRSTGEFRAVEMRDVTLAQLDEFVGKQKGKVVLIDFWATTCVPCVKLFPHTVELHRKHEKDGLVVITVCADPDDYRAKAVEFLKKQGATCVNFFAADPKPSKELDEKYPTTALPSVILYDRAGTRVKALTFSDVDEKAVDELVAKLLAS